MTTHIVQHLRPDPPPGLRHAVDALAVAVRRERPELSLPEPFHDLALDGPHEGPTLHLEDLSEIPRLDGGQDVRFYQDRARLRAGTRILTMQRRLAAAGIWVEPASAAGVAGLAAEVSAGRMDIRKQRVVAVCTGHGLKDPDIIAAQMAKPVLIPAEMGALEEVIIT